MMTVEKAQIRGAILDVDGTLVDSNDAHAHSWVQAMAESGYDVKFEKVRALIGMGGDKVLPETIQVSKESEDGQKISERRKAIFKEKYLPYLRPTPGAYDLLQHMHQQGLKLVVATSAEQDEMDALLKIIAPNAADLFEKETSSKDASDSKPDPDIMQVAIRKIKLSPQELLMLGDTVYDIEAARKVGIDTIAFRSGGWQDKDLAGALVIYNDPADLLQHYSTSPLSA